MATTEIQRQRAVAKVLELRQAGEHTKADRLKQFMSTDFFTTDADPLFTGSTKAPEDFDVDTDTQFIFNDGPSGFFSDVDTDPMKGHNLEGSQIISQMLKRSPHQRGPQWVDCHRL